MLLEDANDAKNASRAQSLTAALAAVREALSMIDSALPPALVEFDAERIGKLYDSLRAPQSRISDAMSDLLREEIARDDAAFIADVCRVRDAAERMLPSDRRRAEPTSMFPVPEAIHATGSMNIADAKRSARVLVVDDIEENRGVLEAPTRARGTHRLHRG